MQNSQQPYFRFADYVKESVRELVQIQSANIRKADRVKVSVMGEKLNVRPEVCPEFKPQSGQLVFIPIDGITNVSLYERMYSQHVHP